jgi:hypothetical protein
MFSTKILNQFFSGFGVKFNLFQKSFPQFFEVGGKDRVSNLTSQFYMVVLSTFGLSSIHI